MSDKSTFRRKLEGSWQCVSLTLTSSEDPTNIIHPWTENVTGSIMYTSDGYMKALICKPNLPHFTPGEYNAAPEQYQEVGAGINAYTGPYTLGKRVGNEQLIYHHVEAGVPANRIGGTQTRYCAMTEGESGRLEIVLRAEQNLKLEGENFERVMRLRFVKKPKNNPEQES